MSKELRPVVLATVVLALFVQNSISAILFPDELQSITSIVYSILPPIKFGKDTRYGVGFRLGRNVDAQVLLELGPQQDTAALGDSSAKRQTNNRNSEKTASLNRQRRAEFWRSIMKRMENTVKASGSGNK